LNKEYGYDGEDFDASRESANNEGGINNKIATFPVNLTGGGKKVKKQEEKSTNITIDNDIDDIDDDVNVRKLTELTHCSKEEARDCLKAADGDFINAVLKITEKNF
jgi:NACalpha-BTF3-like transcription factor